MELSDWCEQVPHAQYFQPIRLQLDDHVIACESDAVVAPTAANPLQAPSTPPRGVQAASPTVASPGTSTPKRLKRRQKPAPSTPQTPRTGSDADNEGAILLPPFQSASISPNRMTLNVGGPVWAMDWLPHDVYKATLSAANKQKKASGTSENKENVSRNVKSSSAALAANDTRSSGKDPLTEWRLLALSTHPPCVVKDGKLVKSTPPDHYYDAPQGGRGLIQIWAIPVIKENTAGHVENGVFHAAPRVMPRLVYAIDHESGVAWDLQWSPLTHKMPRHFHSESLLGVLAVAFGDGSLQIFEVPVISPNKLQALPSEVTVERLKPIAEGRVERIIQLNVRWSPHRWNLLLTGCSDGSVALWNLEEALSKTALETEGEVAELEPQRRFQDADTISKQEPFDWGWGWVAIRAISWSPFDEHLFATTGNDSLFKVWDIREPRICFRSHRIRSTWGLSLQWMDDTSVQISGDQGSIYMYDVLSGSYQKLHFHPQIDSPVWDLQFARRGSLPLLISSCTSGSLRVAPAKKLFRAPQHSLEICRLNGEKNASVDQPHKSLTLSFQHRIVSGSAEAASPATREFCERDASLHRVRLSTTMTGESPCFLATGGHAGLVIIMEMQEELDHVFENYFLQPAKKIGRPRKTAVDAGVATTPWHGGTVGHSKTPKVKAPPKVKRVSAGGVKLSNIAQTKAKTVTLASKLKQKKPSKVSEFPQFEMESASEPEYQEEDGDESDSDSEELSLVDDNSDDDRVVGSDDGDDSDTAEVARSPENPNDVRMRHEYQLDLSEEDAILLAIQMSELEQSTPSKLKSTKGKAAAHKASGKPIAKPVVTKRIEEPKKKAVGNGVAPTSSKKRPSAKASKKQQTPDVPPETKKSTSSASIPKPPNSNDVAKVPVKQDPKVADPASNTHPGLPSDMFVEDIDQTSIQMMIYQQGLSEEDAFREAIRMSEVEMGQMRRSNRKRKASSTPSETHGTSAKSQKRQTPPPKPEGSAPVLSPDEVARRLEFPNASPQHAHSDIPAQSPKRKPDLKALPSSTKKHTNKPPLSAKKKSALKNQASTLTSTSGLTTPKQPVRKNEKASSTSTKSTKTTSSSSTKKAKSKRASSGGSDYLTEEELLAIALQTSQIEY